jgi:hypothetical protein
MNTRVDVLTVNNGVNDLTIFNLFIDCQSMPIIEKRNEFINDEVERYKKTLSDNGLKNFAVHGFVS